MRYSITLLLSVLVIATWVQAQDHQRISQTKCKEYHKEASSPRNNCGSQLLILEEDFVQFGDFPHLAFFGWRKEDDSSGYQFLSSGSLISDRYILTAAHSTRFQQKSPDVVRLGDVGRHQVDFEVAEVVIHPNYTARLHYNDIALVKLRVPVSFSEDIFPACLWDSLQMNFTSLVATGFRDPSTTYSVQTFNLEVMNKSVCEKAYSYNRKLRDGVQDHQLCLINTDRSRDNCQGDSGSPAQAILAPEDCVPYVVGICSYGMGCGGAQFPDIYTRVASYIDWIEAIVWP